MSRIILIVEDSEVCAVTLQTALESMRGLEAWSVRGVKEALSVVADEATEIAAVVTDMHMQRQDGFELIDQLRGNPRYAGLPVLMVSGDSDPLLPKRALAHGANAFFAKPYSPAEVRRTLEKMLC
ncbi:MAG: response regulator [Acidobacteriia bacterium]|jgi:two-component system chemotaxis response regulator CheY|nr:response regulator [Terriglobia bacterium]